MPRTKSSFEKLLAKAKFRKVADFFSGKGDWDSGSSYIDKYDVGVLSTLFQKEIAIAVLEGENEVLETEIFNVDRDKRQERIAENNKTIAYLKGEQ